MNIILLILLSVIQCQRCSSRSLVLIVKKKIELRSPRNHRIVNLAAYINQVRIRSSISYYVLFLIINLTMWSNFVSVFHVCINST